MRTVTIEIAHDQDPSGHDVFWLVEVETLHVVTGDETYRHDIPGAYFNRTDAAKARTAYLSDFGGY